MREDVTGETASPDGVESEAGGEPVWTVSTGGRVSSSPTVVDDTVFVGSYDDRVYALDATSGDQRWTFETGGVVQSSPTVLDGVVFVGSRDRKVYALNEGTGGQIWTFETASGIKSSPTVADERVFVGSADGNVYAVARGAGDEVWRYETGDEVSASPTVSDGTVYIGSHDNSVYALDAASGESIWACETDGQVYSSPTVADGVVFVGSYDGSVYGLDATSGEKLWTFETGGRVESSPTAVDGAVFVGSADGNVYALEQLSGEEIWRFETDNWVFSSPTAAGETVFVGSGDYNVYALDASSGEYVWSAQTGFGVVSSPTVVDGILYVGGTDTDVYAFETGLDESSEDSRVTLGTLGHHEIWADEQKRASFAVEITDTTAPVERGASLDVTVRIRNTSETTDTQAVKLVVPKLGSDSTVIELTGGSSTSETLSVETDNHDAGIYTAEVRSNDDTDSVSAAVGAPASFAVSIADADTAVETGDQIQLTVEVTNTGDIEATQTVQAESERFGTETLVRTLAGGVSTSESISLPTTADAAGEYTVTVSTDDDSATTAVTVLEPDVDQRLPESVPTVSPQSLTYEDIDKGDAIGRGGNADVYRATTDATDSELNIAVKEPRMGGTLHTETVERMIAEAETWQQLDNHDHIVSVVNYGSEPLPWIAMEYMDAGHLGERIDEMDRAQKLWTALSVTEGVYHAHRRGIAHRDLKPENILFRRVENAWDVPKVADWGLSKHLLEHSKSRDGMTVEYAAPEQFSDSTSTDGLTDVYQLGAVFYELFTGRPPFEGEMFAVMKQIETEQPTPPSDIADVPGGLDDVLLTAMAKDRDDRYDDIVYLRDDIEDLFDQP